MYIRPQSIKLDKKRHVLVVDWNDGNSVEYRGNGLRDACPCAQCRDEHSSKNENTIDMVFTLNPVKSFTLDSVELAGSLYRK